MKTLDEQIKEMEDAIERGEKVLAALKEQFAEQEAQKPKAWMPKAGDEYFVITLDGSIGSARWDDDETDKKLYGIGNCYPTQEEAEFEVERLKVETELRRYIYEHGGGNGAFVKDGENHYIHYGWYNSAIGSDYVSLYNFGAIYSNSEQVLRDAIKAIGEARIKKYYLRVKE